MSYAETRDKYRPDTIDVLWIAESPPAGGGYFYFETATPRSHLFMETMRALGWWPLDASMPAGLDKSPYLRRFQESKYFLIDLSPTPVNDLLPKWRAAALRASLPALKEEIEALQPERILIIKRNVFEMIYPMLQSRGFKVLNLEPIPYPSHGWEAEFRQRVHDLVMRYAGESS